MCSSDLDPGTLIEHDENIESVDPLGFRDSKKYADRLTTTKKISDETFARARKIFNDQQIVDLTALAGNYVMVAMLLAMAEETVPPDKQEPFKPGEP